jgi:hypothetical protein
MNKTFEMKSEEGEMVKVAVDTDMFSDPNFIEMLNPEARAKVEKMVKIERFRQAQREYRKVYALRQSAGVSDFAQATEALRLASQELDKAEAEIRFS